MMAWDEVEKNKNEINTTLIKHWKGRVAPAKRSIKLAWMGLAYCFEYGVVKHLIANNPIKHYLPKKPRSGSLID